jgi:phosphatidylinositol alpha 1,6-mannosyltransferase
VLRRRMALAARQSVQGRTWQAVNELLVDHYREVGRTSVTRRHAG